MFRFLIISLISFLEIKLFFRSLRSQKPAIEGNSPNTNTTKPPNLDTNRITQNSIIENQNIFQKKPLVLRKLNRISPVDFGFDRFVMSFFGPETLVRNRTGDRFVFVREDELENVLSRKRIEPGGLVCVGYRKGVDAMGARVHFWVFPEDRSELRGPKIMPSHVFEHSEIEVFYKLADGTVTRDYVEGALVGIQFKDDTMLNRIGFVRLLREGFGSIAKFGHCHCFVDAPNLDVEAPPSPVLAPIMVEAPPNLVLAPIMVEASPNPALVPITVEVPPDPVLTPNLDMGAPPNPMLVPTLVEAPDSELAVEKSVLDSAPALAEALALVSALVPAPPPPQALAPPPDALAVAAMASSPTLQLVN